MFVYKYVCYVVSILVFMLVGVVLIVKGQAECCTLIVHGIYCGGIFFNFWNFLFQKGTCTCHCC